jgi:pilus assembly protein CpaC
MSGSPLVLLLAMALASDSIDRPLPAEAGVISRMVNADLSLVQGRSIVVDYPAEVARISTSDPTVADAVPATSREFLIHAKNHGVATVVVWGKNGLRTTYNITVEHNVEPIRRLLRETFPEEKITLQAARDEVTLTGRVSSKEVADRAVLIATPLAKTVVNHLQVPPPPVAKQVLLRVRFAELNRNASSAFAVNLVPLGAGGTIGRITTGQIGPPDIQLQNGQTRVSLSDALNIFAFRPDLNLMTLVRALQSQGVLQILAEPNLVTISGKEASFLVGGEFPVPVVQGGANAGAITVIFREFGVRLTFNPLITEHETIKLYVKPEVSTLDLANSVTISGFTIPALATRRVETNIELTQGQSFVIGGLIDDRAADSMAKMPGLSAIPVLGPLFKSRSENRSRTELVVIVTPELAPGGGAPLSTPQFPKPFLPGLDPAGLKSVPGANPAAVAAPVVTPPVASAQPGSRAQRREAKRLRKEQEQQARQEKQDLQKQERERNQRERGERKPKTAIVLPPRREFEVVIARRQDSGLSAIPGAAGVIK